MGRVLAIVRRGELVCSVCDRRTRECAPCKQVKDFDPANCPDIVCWRCYGTVNSG